MLKLVRRVAAIGIGGLLLCGCVTVPGGGGTVTPPADQATQNDLTKALGDELNAYASKGQFTADQTALQALDPSLGWGLTLHVFVQDNMYPQDTVCLSEQSTSGRFFAVGDIGRTTAVALAGTYYISGITDPCGDFPTPYTITTWHSHW